MAAPIESKAGTEANHLLIQTVHACFSWNLTLRDRESRQLLNYFCRSLVVLFFFSFSSLQNGKVSFCLPTPLPGRKRTLSTNMGLIVTLQAQLMLGFHGDGGVKYTR